MALDQLSTGTLALSHSQLHDIRNALFVDIQRGLQQDGEMVKALPAYLAPPRQEVSGRCLVFDTGGTHIRVAVVGCKAGHVPEILSGPLSAQLPKSLRSLPMDRQDFYGAHSRLAKKLPGAFGLPVGYCFSYPAKTTPDGDAQLLSWTKDVFVKDTTDTLVGAALMADLKREGLAPQNICVINDTVATLLAGSQQAQGTSFRSNLGLVVATGCNMAAYFDKTQLTKTHWSTQQNASMAVNLEVGNVNPPHLSTWDDELDQDSNQPGAQRLEKALAGYYLPLLFRRIARDASRPVDVTNSKELNLLAQNPQLGAQHKIAHLLLNRSAQLVAALIAGSLKAAGLEGQEVTVSAEGGLFWGDPSYAKIVHNTLSHLIKSPTQVNIIKLDYPNLFGACLAALSRI
jgi:hexokinase